MSKIISTKNIRADRLPSKALKMILEADNLAIAERQEKIEKNISSYSGADYILALLDANCVSAHEIALKCLSLGYSAKILAPMSHEDVDTDFWNELMRELEK